jgi:glutamate/tyrosine decarboxylase-like PLP-dependent enzyme
MPALPRRIDRLGRRALDRVFQHAKRLPFVGAKIAAEYDKMLAEIRKGSKPYKAEIPSTTVLPPEGRSRDSVLAEMNDLATRERSRWHDGFVSGAVYHGDDEHISFLSQVYAAYSQSNPLHADLWPSVVKYEAEIIAMTAEMLGAARVGSDGARWPGPVVGCVSSGGTESIMLAMKTYRDWAKAERGIDRPHVIAPTTAHVAFDKAAQCFGIDLERIPVDASFRADVAATRRAIRRSTICLVGSAPAFPHGTIDPIGELSEIARKRKIGFHTDACLGGFVLPFARELGYDVPGFDFALPGVTSISADTHKYGYAAKGTSVVLYRSASLRRYQFFTATEWPGGMYLSPTFAGSRPGALSAACWASMVSMGRAGYLEATRKILETAAEIRRGIAAIDGLFVMGDPLWVIAFGAEGFDVYRVLDAMTKRGWNLNGLHLPPAVHLCVTLRHTEPGVAQRFLDDLRASVEQTRRQPKEHGGMAPIYGLAGTMPVRSAVGDLMRAYLDVLYET